MSWWDWDTQQTIWRHTVNSGAAIASWKLLYWFAHFKSSDQSVLAWLDKIENVVIVIVLLSLAANAHQWERPAAHGQSHHPKCYSEG
jgi:hypothetical protein